VLKAATAGDPAARPRQVCEARFYLAEEAIIAGDAKAARGRLQQVLKECPAPTLERMTAAGELARLQN
jgi:hypothetical protein